MKQIKNMVVNDNRCMTSLDDKLDRAIEVAKENCLSIRNIIPKREGGNIVGYYVLNEGGETAIETVM